MIPKETDKEGSETSQGTPSEILSPFLALVQLLRDKQCRPPAHYPPCLSVCALGPSMPTTHGLYTCMCPLQDPAVTMQAPRLPRNMHVSPTTVPQPVYRAATSKVRFKVRNFWKSRPSSATTASSSRPRNQDNGEEPRAHRGVGAEGQPGYHTLSQHRLQPDETQPWTQQRCEMSSEVLIN